MELLVCYEDEGVYVNTYGRITKDVVLQWGEMPTSVGMLDLGFCLNMFFFCLNISAFFEYFFIFSNEILLFAFYCFGC